MHGSTDSSLSKLTYLPSLILLLSLRPRGGAQAMEECGMESSQLLPWSVSPSTPFATLLVSPVPPLLDSELLCVSREVAETEEEERRGGASVSPMLSCLAPPR